MKLNKQQLSKKIDKLAEIKAKIASLAVEEYTLSTIIKDQGGGESKKWRAVLVGIPLHHVTIQAHKQLRLYTQE